MTGTPDHSGRRRRGRTAVVVAALVVIGWVALVVGWVALLVVDRGWSRLVWAVFGAFLLWNLLPRPLRVRRRAVAVDAEEAPGLHALVDAVAVGVGARPPRRVLLDTTYQVTALPVGYRGRSDLIVGLPQWTVLRPRERLAAVALALALVEGSAGRAGRLVRVADDILAAGRGLLEPPGSIRGDKVAAAYSVSNPIAVDALETNRMGRGLTTQVGAAGMAVVGAPLRWVQRAMARSWRPRLVADAHVADARAAAVAGREPLVGVLLSTVGTPLGFTAAASAARYGRDPFEALAAVRRPERSEYERLLAVEAEGGAGPVPVPPTAARIDAVERGTESTGTAVDPALATRADADVVRLRAELAAQLIDELRAGSS